MRLFLFLFSAALLISMPVSKAEVISPFVDGAETAENSIYDTTSNPLYKSMVMELLEEGPKPYSFSELRRIYSLSKYYMPQAEKIYSKMFELAFEAQTAEDEDKAARAFMAFNQITQRHLAHMGVILYALSFARDDARFGDVKFLEWVRDGLYLSVQRSGHGQSLQDAYDVIAPEEEQYFISHLLDELDAKIEYTQTKKAGLIYYNRYYMRDRDGKLHQAFVNLRRPMERIMELQSR